MIDIEGKIRKVLVEQLGVDAAEVTREASIVDDLGADSLDTVELIMACEEEFGLEIPDEDAERVRTVGQMIDLVEQKIQVRDAGAYARE